MQKLSHLNYSRVEPCQALQGSVQALWFVDNANHQGEQEFKVFSDSAAGVVINVAGTLNYCRGDSDISVAQGGLIHGASTELLRVKFSGSVAALGIQFYPQSGHQFFSQSMSSIAGKVLPAMDAELAGIEALCVEVAALWDGKNSRNNIFKVSKNIFYRYRKPPPNVSNLPRHYWLILSLK